MDKLHQYQTLELSDESAQQLIDDGWQTNVVTWEFSRPGKGLVIDGNYEIVTNEIDLMELIRLHQQSIVGEELTATEHQGAAACSEKSTHEF
jgi:hypothetical protein